MTHAATTPESVPADTEQTTPNVTQPKVVKIVLGALLVLVILFALIIIDSKRVTESRDNSTNDITKSSSKKSKITWVFDHSVKVKLYPEYKETTYFETGMGMSFSEATEPYDVTNKNGEIAHGERGQDASPQLINSNANTELKFKSSNGKEGYIIVKLYRATES